MSMQSVGQAANPRTTTFSQTISNLEDIERRIRTQTASIHRLADQMTGSVSEIGLSVKDSPPPPSTNIFHMVERVVGAVNEQNVALDRFFT